MEFQIKKADSNDINTVLHIIRSVYEAMPDKSLFAADSDDYIRATLENGSALAYLALEESSQKPAGVLIAAFPGNSPENLGHDAGLTQAELLKSVHMDTAAVLPSFRGQGLQKKLMLAAESELAAMGYLYLFCTVHPENPYSLNSVLALGYEVIKVCEKYGGLKRAVLMKRVL